MSPRDFFKIGLKFFALIVFFYGVIPAFANMFFVTGFDFSIGLIIVLLIFVILFVLLSVYILNKPDKIIDMFKLDKGFEGDNFDFSKLELKYIVEISCALLGLYFIMSSLPNVLYEAFMYFKTNVSNESNTAFQLEFFDKRALSFDVLYVFIGFFAVNYRKWISKILSTNRD